MIIQHNITALNAYNRLSNNNSVVSKNLEKLSSGYRINRAGDDAAGLAISEKMRAQITGLERATLNAQDGISLVQTAEGALTEVHSMLNRMVELGTQSANGTYQAEDRQKIQSEVDALLSEIDRISQSTNFNGINLLDGSLGLDVKAISSKTTGAVTANGFTTVDNVKTSAAATTASAGVFEIDFGGMAVQQNAEGTLTVNFAGRDINIKLSKSDAEDLTTVGAYVIKTDGAGGLTAANLSTKFQSILGAEFKNGAKVTINGEDVTVGAGTAGSGLKITQAGAPATEANVLDLGKSGFSVTFNKLAASTGNVTGSAYHGVKVHTASVATSAAKKAEADIRFDVSKLTNNSTITLNDKTYTIFTKDSGKATVDKTKGEIDLLNYTEADLAEMDKEELQKMVASKVVAAATDTTFGVPAKWNVNLTDDGKGIHLDQLAADTTDYTKAATITALFKSTSVAKNASASITLDDSKIRNGTSVKIGDTLYEFTNDKSKLKNANATAVVIAHMTDEAGSLNTGDAAKALAAVAGGTVSQNDSQTAIIRAKTNTEAAPSVGGAGLTLQIGDTADNFNQVTVAVDDMSAKGLGIDGLKVTDQGWSQDSIDKIRGAIEKVSVNRGNLGALQNRLEHTINNLTTTSENMTAAESRVRDTDMAKEMMDFTKNNVLVQAAQAMLAQANQQPQQVLQLLR